MADQENQFPDCTGGQESGDWFDTLTDDGQDAVLRDLRLILAVLIVRKVSFVTEKLLDGTPRGGAFDLLN